MNRASTYLALLLVIQCALVAWSYWPDTLRNIETTQPQLSETVADLVDEIRIGDEYDNEAVLQRVGEGWLLPELSNLPADTAKVNDLLVALLEADPGWPVAQSAAARQRFKVADYLYHRRLSLLQENQVLDTLYLGSAPAFRKVHARNEQHHSIFAIDFNVHDAPARDDAWLDSRLLQVRGPLEITADTYSLRWQDGDWYAGNGQAPDKRELEALLASLRSLQIEGVAEEDVQRDLSDLEADLVLQINSLGGEVSLELFRFEGRHYIYSSNHNLFFRLSAYHFDRITSIDYLRISGNGTAELK